ncbi:MAG: septal ring lytic transglycosylase RlpA family protein [Proteobacteria bacterium]|nr:septal ring lytic transglycosylase RlpA family protein [Pseudomonadota bacterium]
MRILRTIAALSALSVGAALLSACDETSLIFHSAKKLNRAIEGEPTAEPPPSLPVPAGYKLGNAYLVEGVRYFPHFDPSYNETGIASWYGEPFHGRNTANGERYDMNELTAAHKTMPMPSTARVTNLENGRTLMLRVNDRGPFVPGRIIDISRRGAQLLGFHKNGTAKVRVEFLEFAPLTVIADREQPKRRLDTEEVVAMESEPTVERPAISSQYLDAPESELGSSGNDELSSTLGPENGTTLTGTFVQIGAFAERANAVTLARQLSGLSRSVISAANINGRTLFRVRMGPIADLEQADSLLAKVIGAGHSDARLIVVQ